MATALLSGKAYENMAGALTWTSQSRQASTGSVESGGHSCLFYSGISAVIFCRCTSSCEEAVVS